MLSVYLGTTLNTYVSQWNYIYCYVTDTEKLRHWTAGNESRVIYTYNDCNAKLCLSSSTQQNALRMIPLLTRITKYHLLWFRESTETKQGQFLFLQSPFLLWLDLSWKWRHLSCRKSSGWMLHIRYLCRIFSTPKWSSKCHCKKSTITIAPLSLYIL